MGVGGEVGGAMGSGRGYRKDGSLERLGRGYGEGGVAMGKWAGLWMWSGYGIGWVVGGRGYGKGAGSYGKGRGLREMGLECGNKWGVVMEMRACYMEMRRCSYANKGEGAIGVDVGGGRTEGSGGTGNAGLNWGG